VIQRLGRAYGAGQLKLVQRGAGTPQWTLSWRDEHGVRRQRALSTDRRVAERRMREIIHRRDLALEGVGVDGRDMALEELARLYLEELRSRCVDAHYVNSKSMIERALAGIGVARVGDLLPLHALKYRTQLLASGAAPRTANLHIHPVSAMLAWGVKRGDEDAAPSSGARGRVHALPRRLARCGQVNRRYLRRARVTPGAGLRSRRSCA